MLYYSLIDMQEKPTSNPTEPPPSPTDPPVEVCCLYDDSTCFWYCVTEFVWT